MSFNLSAIAVRERAVTLFFIILMAAAGAYAFIMLGRAEDPSFTIKTLTVTHPFWPVIVSNWADRSRRQPRPMTRWRRSFRP
jgi:hypothetical protein